MKAFATTREGIPRTMAQHGHHVTSSCARAGHISLGRGRVRLDDRCEVRKVLRAGQRPVRDADRLVADAVDGRKLRTFRLTPCGESRRTPWTGPGQGRSAGRPAAVPHTGHSHVALADTSATRPW
jgi:hypothetical protein